MSGDEDLGRLGHEVDAAEHDRLGLGGGRLAREAERVADVVGDVLHLGHLVVVGEDHGAALAGERAHLVLHAGCGGNGHGETSRETSSERAEWVSAPTEMRSTPVSRDRAHVVEGDAARGLERHAPGDQGDGLPQERRRHVVEQDPVGARRECLGDLVERVALDLDRQARAGGAQPLDGVADAGAQAQVVVLDEDPVVQSEAMVRRASAGHGALLERAQARRRLARVQDRRAGALHGLDVAPRERGDARHAREQVERSALARQHGARGSLDRRDRDRRVRDLGAFGDKRGDAHVRVERGVDRDDRVEPADHAGLLHEQARATAQTLVEQALARAIAGVAEILGERVAHDAVERGLGQLHCSTTASAPGRSTTWPSKAGFSAGKSTRKCAPRLSARCRALRATRLASRWRGRRRSKRSRPAASRTSPASRHMAARSAGVTGSSWAGSAGGGRRAGQPGLVQHRERRTTAEHEAFEQRVRGQPVRAVHAGAGALAGREQAVDAGAPVEVGDDAAHRVVRRRRDRDGLERGVEALARRGCP